MGEKHIEGHPYVTEMEGKPPKEEESLKVVKISGSSKCWL